MEDLHGSNEHTDMILYALVLSAPSSSQIREKERAPSRPFIGYIIFLSNSFVSLGACSYMTCHAPSSIDGSNFLHWDYEESLQCN